MKTMTCIIVDDEAPALDLLEDYVGRTPGLELAGRFSSAMEAMVRLDAGGVDLMFLDIQMPKLRGTAFLQSLSRPPIAIFTTAYRQYATDAFELDAVDYLLKPFAYERFLRAVGKARDQFLLREGPAGPGGAESTSGHLIIKADGKLIRIRHEEIIFIEGWKEYVRIYTPEKRYVTLEALKNLEETLPPGDFLRIHKSYIVALGRVRAIYGNQVELEGHTLPIGRTLKEEVLRRWTGS